MKNAVTTLTVICTRVSALECVGRTAEFADVARPGK